MGMFSKPKTVKPATIDDKKVKEAELLKQKQRKTSGHQENILTSPVGVTTPAPVQPKTLLGS